jgi:hypothetical protein
MKLVGTNGYPMQNEKYDADQRRAWGYTVKTEPWSADFNDVMAAVKGLARTVEATRNEVASMREEIAAMKGKF